MAKLCFFPSSCPVSGMEDSRFFNSDHLSWLHSLWHHSHPGMCRKGPALEDISLAPAIQAQRRSESTGQALRCHFAIIHIPHTALKFQARRPMWAAGAHLLPEKQKHSNEMYDVAKVNCVFYCLFSPCKGKHLIKATREGLIFGLMR